MGQGHSVKEGQILERRCWTSASFCDKHHTVRSQHCVAESLALLRSLMPWFANLASPSPRGRRLLSRACEITADST
jgi:hypothetical protein